MNSARIELQRSFVVNQARVVVVAVDEVGAPKIMGVLNFPGGGPLDFERKMSLPSLRFATLLQALQATASGSRLAERVDRLTGGQGAARAGFEAGQGAGDCGAADVLLG